MLDDKTKDHIKELMFHTVSDPDEVITDEVLAKTESVNYDESVAMKKEFRAFIEGLNDHPNIRMIVLEGLDDLIAVGNQPGGGHSSVEWMNTHEVIGRRIRKAMAPLLA